LPCRHRHRAGCPPAALGGGHLRASAPLRAPFLLRHPLTPVGSNRPLAELAAPHLPSVL